MSWLGAGAGKGGGGGGQPPQQPPTAASKSSQQPPKVKKRERWLVTRKTWRYMADAGKLLIPELLRKGKDYKDYTEEDIELLEQHFSNVCDQQQEFVIWEGPVEDPRVLLANNRKAPSQQSDLADSSLGQSDSLGHSSQESDYRFESHSAKFRIVLPTGEKPPPGYTQDPAEWSLSDSSPLDSGILSPSADFLMSPREHSPSGSDEEEDEPARESGIGSGLVDAIGFSNKCNMGVQTDPLPQEFYDLRESEDVVSSLEATGSDKTASALLAKDDEEKICQETDALAKREQRRTSVDYDPATMGETVMRYLKMVRRNSKSVDQKKAERFRSMNYDPTLRNIKSKYVHTPGDQTEEEAPPRHEACQCDESIIRLLKKCKTAVDPPKPRENKPKRKFSLSPSETDTVFSPLSPRYSISQAEEPPVTPADTEQRDFFGHLYTGETNTLDSGSVPEDYYTYLEGWYRSQVTGPVAAAKSGSIPSLTTPSSTSSVSPFPFQTSVSSGSGTFHSTTGTSCHLPSQGGASISHLPGLGATHHSGLFIPVSTLQSLRSSLPSHLPQISSGPASSPTVSSVPLLGISRSSASLSSVSTSQQTSSLSFLSSVISRGRSTSHTSAGGRGSSGSAGKIITKKLFRHRSKSAHRTSCTPIPSPWTPQEGCCWHHVTGQAVTLQDSTLLHLLDIERTFLQKQAQSCLTAFELGTAIRIPKDNRERNEVSKTRKRANLLKKKVLSAGNLGPKPEKEVKGKQDGAVFGIPITQCVEGSRKRSTTDIPSDEMLSPTSKSSRSDSRTSFGSIFESVHKDKSSERVCSPLQSSGSLESLNLDLRRCSYTADSQSGLDTLSYSSCDRLLEAGETPDRINPQPCIPPVVNTCIKYLELHGLHTVGIFRVGTSKKRVRQLREDFDSGAEVIIAEDVSAHDVATILKEFFRDLPEPLLPREIYHPLLAVQKIRNRKQQIEAMKRIIQLLPQVNRDTLYVLLNFLHLVAENSEDRKGPQGEDIPGNKMDSNNLATLFAPNILHSMKNPDGTTSPENAAKAAERTETINIIRSLIDYNRELFELSAEDLHQLYLRMYDQVPESLDYQLRRRAILNGDEYIDGFDYNVIYDMPEPRLLGPNDPQLLETQDRKWSKSDIPPIIETDVVCRMDPENELEPRLRKKEDERGRARRRGSEDTQEKGASWFRFREKSDSSEPGEMKWFNKKRDKSHSTSTVRTASTESVSSQPPPRGIKKEKSGGVVTGSLRINVAGIQAAGGGGQTAGQTPGTPGTPGWGGGGSAGVAGGDVDGADDEQKRMKVEFGKRVVLRRLSQDTEGKILACEIHIPSIRSSTGTPGTDSILYSPSRGASPIDPVFSGSGTSTPSNPMSPTALQPGTPVVFSPPPSPMSVTPTPAHRGQPSINVEVETRLMEPRSQTQDVSLVLKPVPVRSRPSPADSVNTLVNDSIPDIQVSSEDRGPSPHPLGLRRLAKDERLASSSLSLPSEAANGNRLSAFSASDMRSKTDNLDRLITEVERSASENLSGGGGGGGREVKKYIRRRYTDSRHPTTELPDVRGDLPSVQNPPLSKSKSKLQVQDDDTSTESGRGSTGNVTERASYRRWQKSGSRNLDSDS